MYTNYFLDLIAKNVFKSALKNSAGVTSLPGAYYLGLSKTTPTANGQSEEPSWLGYSRINITNLINGDANGKLKNESAISFAETGEMENDVRVTHFCIFDSATGGNLLVYDVMSPARSVGSYTVVSIKPEKLQLSIENKA